jgi:hypothetical protein
MVGLKPERGDIESDQGTKTAKTGWLGASRSSRLDSIYVEGYSQGFVAFIGPGTSCAAAIEGSRWPQGKERWMYSNEENCDEGSHQFKDVGDKSYVAFYVETDTLQSHRPLVSTASKFM